MVGHWWPEGAVNSRSIAPLFFVRSPPSGPFFWSGGCDIILELAKEGELKETVEEKLAEGGAP